MKYRKDMGKKMLHLADYLKKRILFFDFSRIINNFAVKFTKYEEETIHHNSADGGIRTAQ